MADDKVKVKVSFDADPSKVGETREVSVTEAYQLVNEGRATYATEAQERKAEKLA